MLRSTIALAAAGAVLFGVSSCSLPDDNVQAVTIKNDTHQTVVLRLCDSFGCDNLNDRLRPGQKVPENVNTSDNPYRLQVVDTSHRPLGCLDVPTQPVPSGPVAVSSMRPSTGKCG